MKAGANVLPLDDNIEYHAPAIAAEDAPRGDLSRARAYWVARDTILWDGPGAPGASYSLFYDPDGARQLKPTGSAGGSEIELAFAGLGAAPIQKFPHLSGLTALKLAPSDLHKVPAMLRGQLALAVRDDAGRLLDASSVQIPGVLDELYAYEGPLGIAYDGAVPTLRLWAPTARSVTLYLFDDSRTAAYAAIPMSRDANTGVWSVTGVAGWTGKFYLYEVEVFVPGLGAVVKNLVTDPYAISLSTNSARSQIVDLACPSLKPDGWDSLRKPPLDAPEDIVLYELHVRDFSIGDQTVPERERGTYLAFTRAGSNGMRHLKALALAGVTHVHLLPVFDIVSIEEDRGRRVEPDARKLALFPPDSPDQQAAIGPLRDRDGFNWGYDPYHYTTPEGSYATDPDGPARIREFRAMIQALNEAGLRVVMDVVYNHTCASGQNPHSVLDKIVPGYYHRLNREGAVENSTCCHNTASEHAMMEKLMVDSLKTWATAYKVDGFRIDLMGHHMAANVEKIRDTLHALTPEQDGVDGVTIYLYGEGWDFGEVAGNQRGRNAAQMNMAGTGIGAFNDRLRDAVRGGGPFSGVQAQGFASGLFTAPNATDQGAPADQRDRLLAYVDWIKIGLAGGLRDYWLVNRHGDTQRADQIPCNGQPAGYTLAPCENVVYVSAHDNETLFDAVQLKAPALATIAERARMATMALSVVALSQGIPFFHAGDEILRSKSLDRNSYNSGDWFNKLDWTYESNNWGVGLPPAGENQRHWPIMRPLLANPALKPAKPDILAALARFEELLKIRKSSRLFRLASAGEVRQKLSFLNTGPHQIPGLIVMRLADGGANGDDACDQIVVLFNATSETVIFADDSLKSACLGLHPIQANSHDPVVRTAMFSASEGTFKVPAYTTAVFVGVARPASHDNESGLVPVGTQQLHE